MSKTKIDYSSFFSTLENDVPFFKLGIQGFSGTGKTYLTAILAIGLHKKIKSTKPILVYDTEKAFRTLKDLFDAAGVQVLHRKSRTLTDLEIAFNACEEGVSDILLIDSITHVWQNYIQAYTDAKKERLRKPITSLSFPDWAFIKPEWKRRFSDRIINGNVHLIFTGRAGYEYEYDENEETKKMTELRKSGIKMKAESETAYEPDILLLMERQEELLGKNKKIYRTATVLKDRYRLIDGKIFVNPTFADFEPVIEKALDGKIINAAKETPDSFDELKPKSDDWIKRRDVALEEIENLFTQIGLGTSKEHKKIKVDLLDKAFSTTSWTKIQTFKVETLERELNLLKQFKDEFLNYLKSCNESGENPQMEMAYEYMDQVWNLPM